jgi:hypothetical protein
MTVSVFGVEDPVVAKADRSERTKLLAIGSGAAAGYAGAAHSAAVMSRHQARQHWNKARTGPGKGNFTIPKARAAQSHLRLMNSSLKAERNARHARTGLALTAAGLGTGAYASHRRDRMGKSAFGIEH